MITSARVDIEVASNQTWNDAFQFGVAGDTSWSFTGMVFHLDIKADKNDAVALLSLTTANGRIVVDDLVNRILNFNVNSTDLLALPIGEYQYDLCMLDASAPPVRVPLMHGEVKVKQGVTLS